MSWLEKHRESFVDEEKKEEASVREVPVESPSKKPLPAEIEIKKEIATEPITLEKVPEEKESEIVSDKKVYTVQVGGFSAEKNALNLAKR